MKISRLELSNASKQNTNTDKTSEKLTYRKYSRESTMQACSLLSAYQIQLRLTSKSRSFQCINCVRVPNELQKMSDYRISIVKKKGEDLGKVMITELKEEISKSLNKKNIGENSTQISIITYSEYPVPESDSLKPYKWRPPQ